MNVAIFTDNDFGKVNGVTTALKAAVRYAPEGIRPRVYTSSDEEDNRPEYFAVSSVGVGIPFLGGMKMYWPRALRLLREARKDRVDLVHYTTPGPVGLAAMFVASRMGLPMVASFHTDLAAYTAHLSGSPRLGALVRGCIRWPYGKCERVLAPSENTRRLLIDATLAADRVGLWPRGVDAHQFCPARRSVSLRERWRVHGHRLAVLYVGRISKEKGLAMMPRIHAALRRRAVDHQLVFVGSGPMQAQLQAALPDAIFTGTLSPAAVAEAMASADLFVFPSDTDSAGNVVLEAQACGLPVIVSSMGGPGEYIRPGETGVICPAGDAEAFGHEAAKILRDARRRRLMSDQARAHALTLRWEAALAPLYDTYREVVALAARRHRTETPGTAAHGSAAA